MRHVQLQVARARIGARDLPLSYGTLQVVERDASLDWELVLHTIDLEPIARSVHRLHVEAIVGAAADGHLVTAPLDGDAILVRTVDHAIVLRGEGPLAGFDPGLLG